MDSSDSSLPSAKRFLRIRLVSTEPSGRVRDVIVVKVDITDILGFAIGVGGCSG